MDIMEALRTRRSVRNFSDKPVSVQMLSDLVDVARYSPSGANKNPWRFVILTERNILDRLSEVHIHCRWFSSAQAGIAIAVDPASSRYWLEDCSVAAYTICLGAMACGLGAGWAAMYQSDDAAESERRQQLVRELLTIPDTMNVPMVLAIGYPQARSAERKRPALEEISNWERYTLRGREQA
jgi:nitroreductase